MRVDKYHAAAALKRRRASKLRYSSLKKQSSLLILPILNRSRRPDFKVIVFAAREDCITIYARYRKGCLKRKTWLSGSPGIPTP
jgi:hypothetical protein